MKIIQKILFFIAGLLALLCGFIIICAMKPDVTEKIKDLLYQEERQQEETGEPESEPESSTVLPVPDVPKEGEESGNGEETEPESTGTENEENSGDTVSRQPDMPYEEEEDDWVRDEAAYAAPSTSNVVVPDKVKGKNGYRQVHYEIEQLDEEAADKLQSKLEIGDAGDGIDFDTGFYPYYAMLEDDGQHLYRQIYANANNLFEKFAPVEAVSAGQLKDVFAAVYNDHPELFWLETSYLCKYRGNGECVEIDLRFNSASKDLGSAKSKFNEKANTILSGAKGFSDDYEKEKYVHDQLLEKTAYDSNAEMNQSAYSALVNGKTVCAGYARAFQYLMQKLDIPCYYCTGFAGESHAWNIIGLEDGYYNVDTTWDDTDKGTYDYFNKTDEDFELTHVRQDLSVNLPACNGTQYRNRERKESDKRTLADLGISEEQVIKNLKDYYEDCYKQIVNNGTGSYKFSNVIEGKALYDEIYKAYFETDGYIDGFMERALQKIDGISWECYLYAEELRDNRYLLTLDVTIQ